MAVDAFGDHIPGTPRTGISGEFQWGQLVLNPSDLAWPEATPTWNGQEWVDPNGGRWNPQPARPQAVDTSGPAAFAIAAVGAFITAGASLGAEEGTSTAALDFPPDVETAAPIFPAETTTSGFSVPSYLRNLAPLLPILTKRKQRSPSNVRRVRQPNRQRHMVGFLGRIRRPWWRV